MRTQYREKRYQCGSRYLEVDIFPVYSKGGARGRKAQPSSEGRKALNQRNAEKKLERLILTNFSDGDIEIHLTYDNEHLPKTDEEDASAVRAFMRRVKRYIDKNIQGHTSKDLKWINITEGGVGGKRYHHHMTMSGLIPREVLERIWGNGFANSKRLKFDDAGVEGLVRYITKQSRCEERELGRKRWSSSQNLEKPIESQRDGKISAKQLREATRDDELPSLIQRKYPGYRVVYAKTMMNSVNGGYYLTAKLYRDKVQDRRC